MQYFHKYRSRDSSSAQKRNKFLALHIKNLQNSGRISIGSGADAGKKDKNKKKKNSSSNKQKNNNDKNKKTQKKKKKRRRRMDDIDQVHIDTTGADFGDDGYQDINEENRDPNIPARRKSARKAKAGGYYTDKEDNKEDDAPATPTKQVRSPYKTRSRNKNNKKGKPRVRTPGTNELFAEDISSGKNKQNALILDYTIELRNYFHTIKFNEWIINQELDQPNDGFSYHGIYDPIDDEKNPLIYKQVWRPHKLPAISSPPIELLIRAFSKTQHAYYLMSDLQMCFLKSDPFKKMKLASKEVYNRFCDYCWTNYAAISNNPFFGTMYTKNVAALRV